MARRLIGLVLYFFLGREMVHFAGSMNFSPVIVWHLFDADNAMTQSLPPNAIAATRLLRRHGVRSYRLDQPLTVDWSINQRIIEASYPARVEDSAGVLIAMRGGRETAGCREMDHEAALGLYDCARHG